VKGVSWARQDMSRWYPSTPTPILEPYGRMSHAYFGNVNRSFVDISGVLLSWSELSEKFIVYEHTPDDGCAKAHCHVLALGIQLDTKQLYKRKEWKALGMNGRNKEFGFAIYEPGRNTLEYMSKGMFDPKFNKGFTQEEIDAAKAKGYSKKIVVENEDVKNVKESEFEQMRKDFQDSYYYNNTSKPMLVDVRRWVFRWYWNRNGQAPFALNYKRNASSLYYGAVLAAAEKNPGMNCESTALDEILDWAY